MIVAFLIGAAFYRSAQRKNLMPWLWAIIGFLGWFAGQLLAGIVIGLTNPEVLNGDEMDLIIPSLAGAIVTSVILFVVLEMAGKNKNKKKETLDEDLLDEQVL